MDLPQSIRAIPLEGSALEIVRRRVVPVLGAVILAVMLWDLYNHRASEDSPAITVFFPRLYMWLFGGFAAALVWGTLKAIHAPVWRAVAGITLLVAVILTVVGTPDGFPFYAPGQDQHEIEGQRVREIDALAVNVLGVEVKPESLDNKVDDVVSWMVTNWKAFFRGVTDYLLNIMVPMDRALQQMPMWAFITVSALAAWRVSSFKIAAVTAVGLLFVGIFGLWPEAMLTMTVVATATFLSIATAIPVGIAMAKSDKVEGLIRPALDMMQTMPSFVYLIPAIFFLGIGLVPAVIATMIYAVPPAIRLTNLGIRLVSPELIEAAAPLALRRRSCLLKSSYPSPGPRSWPA